MSANKNIASAKEKLITPDKLMEIIEKTVNNNNENAVFSSTTVDYKDFSNMEKTNKRPTDSKQNNNDQQDSRFSIANLLAKNENPLIHKKNFFVISDEIREDDEDISVKMKREVLLNKLINDKGIVHEHAFNQEFHDKVSNELYLGLSMDSRKFLLSEPDEITYRQFHELIDFDNRSTNITNDIIMNLCNGFIKLSDCIFLI